MGKSEKEQVGPESVEAGLRAVFGKQGVLQGHREAEGVLGALGLDSVRLRDALPAVMIREHAGEAVGDRRYQVLGEIARGGVGIIFKSRDRDLEREVAIKVLRSEYAKNPEVLERFVEEAQIGGQLQHPGIVPVYGLGLQADGRPYFAMKLVRGQTLSEILAARKNPREGQRRLLGIFEQICQTVAYAHARGVIHRDLKPGNVMTGAFGEVQVVDWGFAKVLGSNERAPKTQGLDQAIAAGAGPDQTIVATVRSGESTSHSMAGSVMGTPAYMPPEQALGQIDEINERADVFTLGGILCEILTGKPPYAGKPIEIMTMAVQGRIDGALSRLDGCGAERPLVELAGHCLAPLPGDRPRDAGAVAHAIHEQLAAAEERARRMELAAAEERAKEVEEQARLARQVAEAREEEARVAKEKRQAEKERARQKEERKRAEFERKARRRSLAMAVSLLVAVVVGVVGLLWSQAEASDRARQIASQVSSDLRAASGLEGRGKFSEALAAAKGALNVARDADPDTRERVRTAVARIKKKKIDADEHAKRRANDEKLIAEWRSSVFGRSWRGIEASTVAIFRKYGIDLTDPEAAAERIRVSEYSAVIASVLDQMSFARRTEHKLGGDWRTLVRMAKKADPDELRNRLRDAGAASDVDALLAMMPKVQAQNPPARTQALLGYALYHCGRYREAIDFLRGTARLHPDNDLTHLILALLLKSVRPPLTQEAARHAAALVALRPKGVLVRMLAAFFANDYRAALRICDAILAKDPKNLLALRERGSAFMHLGDWKGAVSVLREVTRLDAGDALAWQDLAESHFRSGDPVGALAAVRDAEKSVATTPHVRAFSLLSHGLFLSMSGEHGKGIGKATEAVKAAPDFALAHWCLGTVLRRAGHAGPAANALRDAIELDPSADAHADLGIVLSTDHPVAALSHFHQAVALDPAQPDHHANLAGFLLWRRGDPDHALRVANQALRLDGNHARAWTVLIGCYWMKGRMDLHARYARQAHQLNPGAADAILNVALIHAHRRDYTAALTWARRALDSSPAAHGMVGWCLMHQGRFAEARTALRTCIERAPPKGADNQYGREFRARVMERIEVCERVKPFEARKDAIVGGKLEPQSPAQALAFADLCYFVGAFERATALYRTGDAVPADRRGRERVAHAAVQSGPKGRPYALQLLRTQYEAQEGRGNGAGVRNVLWEWKRTPYLAPVRDPIPLAKLPDAERDGWVPFWKDVDALLKRSLEAKQ